MSVPWHVIAWVALLAGLTLWMWPLDPGVSVIDMAEMTGLERGAGNTLDALFSDQPIEGTALLRSWIGGVLIGGAAATELVIAWRRRRQRRRELPQVPSQAQYGYHE